MKNFLFVLFAIAAWATVAAPDVYAFCACCSEKGEYSIRTSKPTAYEMGLIDSLRFGSTAELFMTEAGFDTIKGLKTIEKDYDSMDFSAVGEFFSLTNTFAAKTWKFDFKTKTGKTGTLVLPMPLQLLNFRADIHDGSQSGGGGPLLYKEWRFKGNVRAGNGFFSSGIAGPTSYFLVLQGRGNNCDNAEDFTNWRLEIDGKNARYAFFGKMNEAKSDAD